MAVLGFDIDGVLAAFDHAFIERIIAITGRDVFPPRPFVIPTWDFPQFYGYSEDEVSAAWKDIKADCLFWQELPGYADTYASLRAIRSRQYRGDDIYFVTSRVGVQVKQQTENWLVYAGYSSRPTVLISSTKGLIAAGLRLDAFLDDRWENALDVSTTKTRSFLLNRSWNTEFGGAAAHDITRVDSVTEFLSAL